MLLEVITGELSFLSLIEIVRSCDTELEPSDTAPGEDPVEGTYWFDTTDTLWGIQQWNGDSIIDKGQIFTNKVPIVITDSTQVVNTGSNDTNGITGDIPAGTVGANGDYAVIATTTLNKIFSKFSNFDLRLCKET